ncbi:MAG: F0F1 ATP synthase subunit B [Candidatus Pacebacteria bacterium]|nr:F0F1 ATP synthase subunit B [Candidatus Paceibacterota bacterium]
MDSFIETFHIDWKIIIAQVINFAIVLFVLQYLALKPLKKLMAERTERINGGLEDATKNAEILKNTKNEYDTILSNARIEANTIFQEGKKEAESKKAEMMENAKNEVDNMILNGKKVLESEKAKIIEDAKKEIVSLVVLATEKLLESHPNDKSEDKSINQLKNL